jgi:MFS family permease
VAEQTRSRGQLLNTCIGAVVFTLMGSLWAVFGIWSLGHTGEPVTAILLALTVMLLLIAGIASIRKVLRLPHDVLSPEVLERIKHIKRIFGLVNVLQGIAIGATFAVGFRIHHPEYIPPVVALIVGLHFFALAPILRMPFDYVIGALLCLLALATVLIFPVYTGNSEMSSEHIFLWGIMIGIGSAIVLWAGAVYRLLSVRATLHAQ